MDMIEILGSLLGQRAGGSGAGADILKEILGGAKRPEAPRTAPAPTSREWSESDIERQARELEDLLNVANDRTSSRVTPQPKLAPQPQAPRQPEALPRQGRIDSPQDDAVLKQNEQATTLVRAMVNAVKCDGQITQAEQQQILSQLPNPSPATVQFLRDEFAKPLDVREFCWSVPVGMEQQVYSMSLIAIDVDTAREEGYLRELAQGLRLRPEVCDQIKGRLTGESARFATVR